jgi:hypothetical protein
MSNPSKAALTTDIAMKFRIRGGKTVMVLPDGTRAIERKEAIVDSTMVKIIARGHRWHRLLSDGAYPTIEDLAAAEKINPSFVSRVTRLAFLSPAITEAILEGRHPAWLTMRDLLAPFPMDWHQQEQKFLAQFRTEPTVATSRAA